MNIKTENLDFEEWRPELTKSENSVIRYQVNHGEANIYVEPNNQTTILEKETLKCEIKQELDPLQLNKYCEGVATLTKGEPSTYFGLASTQSKPENIGNVSLPLLPLPPLPSLPLHLMKSELEEEYGSVAPSGPLPSTKHKNNDPLAIQGATFKLITPILMLLEAVCAVFGPINDHTNAN